MSLDSKINQAKDRIRQAIDECGPNRIYSAYSGGKDSQAVLRLARCVLPNVIVIHNGHAGEDIGDVEGVLCVKEPKAQLVPIFLQTVDLVGQLDGTRRDEDKTVIFDGEEIHRSKMPDWKTYDGVFGLRMYYPLFDWTEEEVFAYLETPDENLVRG